MKQSCTVLNIHITGIQEYTCNGKSCNRNSDSDNMTTWIIKACIQVNPCNSVIRIWHNCVQSIRVAMIQIYEITVFSGIVYLYISGTWTWNNNIHCNSSCVTVIDVHEIIVPGVIVYSCRGATSTWNSSVQCNKYLHEITVSRVLECPCNNDTSTCNNSVRVTLMQAHDIIMFSNMTWQCLVYRWLFR